MNSAFLRLELFFNSLHHSNVGGVAGLCITRENKISLSTTNDHSFMLLYTNAVKLTL